MPAPFPSSFPSWLAGSSPRVRAMCAELRECLLAWGPDVSERIRGRHAVYMLGRRPFAYAFPQGTRLRILLNLKRGELEDPDGVAESIVGRSHEGQGDWTVVLANGLDPEHAMPLVRQTFEAAERRA
ncbi:MAG: hypothetical protein K6E40_08290 [Desulfovibrio sp.]|nr:hypothetical protein [Desulfovibrio sp.]